MDDLTNYYKSYYEHNGYTMEIAKDTSRVLFLKEWLHKYVPEKGTVLDIGCGDSYLAKSMPEYNWVGIDINLKHAEGVLVEHDLMTRPYPFKSSSFDAIVCSETLEHLWDLRVVHKEAYRLLKSGGTYLVSTPNFDHIDHFLAHFRQFLFDTTKPWLFEHIRFYNVENHSKMLADEKFKVLETCGADAHYTNFFIGLRTELYRELVVKLKLPGYDMGKVDQLIGKGIPHYSHTIMLAARKL